ncbi:MAG: hypothetical protein VX669_07770 [Planctomycetota bacterium]|nr:hypothetical protein [Planctomycetota bacterium]
MTNDLQHARLQILGVDTGKRKNGCQKNQQVHLAHHDRKDHGQKHCPDPWNRSSRYGWRRDLRDFAHFQAIGRTLVINKIIKSHLEKEAI